ncbi:MAG: hypothetical protein II077_11150, partial [Treponema sp.]|nr:hypothetical protein [Treponema sp.]
FPTGKLMGKKLHGCNFLPHALPIGGRLGWWKRRCALLRGKRVIAVLDTAISENKRILHF